MGVLQDVTGPVSQRFSDMGTASQVGVMVAAFVALSVIVHVTKQILFKNPNEPPVVFSWFPIIGSTITYGMDPPRFFEENRAKVSQTTPDREILTDLLTACILTVWRLLHIPTPRQEDHRLRRHQRKRVHPERQAEGRERRGDLQCLDHTCFWKGCRLRLPERQADGAEEGA